MGVQPEAPTESSQGAQSPRAKGATSEVPPGQKAKGEKNHDHLLGSTAQKGHGHSRLSYQPNLCKVGGEEERLHSHRACDKKSLIVPQLFERLHFPTKGTVKLGAQFKLVHRCFLWRFCYPARISARVFAAGESIHSSSPKRSCTPRALKKRCQRRARKN